MINADEEMALGYLIDPCFELTNTAGKPLTDGYINVYVHGTRNKYYCYSDWNGNLHPFNIPLDGLGSNVVLASPQFTYDVYVYNKYGTLQMSRYNVSPVGVGEVSVSGINEIVSNDGTVEISQYGDTFDLSVPDITAVSGLVEDVAELTTAVSSIQEELDDLSSAVSGKKDKQEPYSFSENGRQTVSYLSQNANGNVSMGSTKSIGSEYTVVHSGTTSNKFAKIAEFPCYSGFSWVGSGFTNLVVSVSDAGGARQAMISVGLTQAANGNHNFAAPLRYYVSVNQSSTMELKKVYLFSDTPYGNSQVQATISLWAEFTDLTQKQWTFKAENNYATPGTGGTPKANAWEFANGQRYPVSALPTGGWQLNSQDPMYATQTPDWNETSPSSRSFIRNKPDLNQYVTQEELATAVSALSVQSDWEQSDSTKPDYIKNKPDMSDYVTQEELVTAVSGLGVQSDWTEQDSDSPAYIQHKPEEKDLVAGDGIEITVSGTSVIISSDNPAVTGYVTEQELASVSGTLQLEIETVSGNPRVKTVEYGVDRWSDVVAAMNGVSSGKYDYVVMKYTSNGIDLYAPLIKYEAGSSAFFACPAHVSDTVPGYGERRATEIFIINSGDMWFDRTIRPFQGKLIGRGNVSITVQGEDYIVSGSDGSFEQVNSDWDAVSGVAEILNKPETVEIETVGVSAGSGIAITEAASGIVISCTVTGGGSTYTAGNNIDITNDVISVTDVGNLVAGSNVGITVSGSDIIISASGNGGASYTAGDGIDITGDVISAEVDGVTMSVNASGELVSNKKFVDLTYNSSTWADFTAAYTKLQNGEIDGIRVVYSYVTATFYADYVYSKFSWGGIPVNAVFVTPAYASGTPAGYSQRRNTLIFTLTSAGAWSTEYSYGFDGKIIAGSNVTVTASGSDYIISAQGGGSSYTAGDNINITNDVISVTGTGELIAGNNITITASGTDYVISSNGEAQVQSDWDETNTSSKAYIQNKPTIHTYSGASGIDITNDVISLDDPINLVAGNNITIEVTGVSAVISSTDGGTTYTAGTGIDISNQDVISVKIDGSTITTNGSGQLVANGGGTSYSAGNMISLTNNTISVSTTAGITDIQQVAALPANPVSSVLYLIPEV
jgi:hypothetical protein